jgi:hypothetical protein
VHPVIGKLPVAVIDTSLILRVIEPIWSDKNQTAIRLRGRIEKVLDWATVRGYRTGDNPARWQGHLSEVLPTKPKSAKAKHYAALPYAEAPAFVAQLASQQGIGAKALEFLILTAGLSAAPGAAARRAIAGRRRNQRPRGSRCVADQGRPHKAPSRG